MKKFNLQGKKICIVTLSGLLVFTQGALPVCAASDASKKEEVVYANLGSDGTVNGLYVVNSFDGGDIVDYGDYSSIRNLTTMDTITYEDGKISFHTDAKKVYYQGDLNSTELPWNISIQYYLDGTQYLAEELAGKTGTLKMVIDITQNPDCPESFYKGYALQATLLLDSEQCKNIVAQDATIANVGSDKQLSYIILPDKGATLTITADVTDFEMDGISINGTKLNLNFDVDTKELTDQLTDIQDAVKKLDDGSDELYSGSKDLNDGSKTLYDGSVTLNNGAKTLNSGIASLNEGIKTVQDALNTLDGQSGTLTKSSAKVLDALKKIQTSLQGVSMDTESLGQLSEASIQIQEGINSLCGGLAAVNQSIDTYHEALVSAGMTDINAFVENHNQALAALKITNTQRCLYEAYATGGNEGLQNQLGMFVQAGDAEALSLFQQYQASQDPNVLVNYVTQAGTMIQLEQLLRADVSYIQGSSALINGIDAALDPQNGQLMTGAITLQSRYVEFNNSIQQLVVSLKELSASMGELKTSIDSLTTEYTKLDQGINDYTDAEGKIREGYKGIYEGSLKVANGAASLYEGTSEMVDGSLELYNGTGDLKDGARKMSDGTKEFYNETQGIDKELDDKVDEKINDMTGRDKEIVSFVSDKNENTSSVLFVIKTPSITKEEVEEEVKQDEPEKSFFDKFFQLFHK